VNELPDGCLPGRHDGRARLTAATPAHACGCREPCHVMRPARTRVRGRRVGRLAVAERDRPPGSASVPSVCPRRRCRPVIIRRQVHVVDRHVALARSVMGRRTRPRCPGRSPPGARRPRPELRHQGALGGVRNTGHSRELGRPGPALTPWTEAGGAADIIAATAGTDRDSVQNTVGPEVMGLVTGGRLVDPQEMPTSSHCSSCRVRQARLYLSSRSTLGSSTSCDARRPSPGQRVGHCLSRRTVGTSTISCADGSWPADGH
jgi:hypothetical protein